MPLLALFTRKDKSAAKSKDSSSQSTSSHSGHDHAESEYVWSPSALSVPSLDNGGGYRYNHSNDSRVSSSSSSTKIRQLFKRKQQSASPLRQLDPIYDGNDSSTATSMTLNDNTIRPSTRHPVFPSFHDSEGVSSTRSLPADAHRRPAITPLKKVESRQSSHSQNKSSGLFSWISRERTKSKPSEPPVLPPLPILPGANIESFESFNLKSFRHVQLTDSPTLSPAQSDALLPPAVPRPRGSSMASSDSAQRISVGQFRAQARRSTTNVASAGNSPSVRPVSLADSQMNSDKELPPPRPPRASRPTPSPVRHSKVSSSALETSSESSSEESDSDDRSRPRSRSSQQKTITPRSRTSRSDLGHGKDLVSHHRQTTSSRSELGHGSPSRGSPARGPPPSSFQKSAPSPSPSSAAGGTRSFSLYRRQQESYSTNELSMSAAAQRANVIAAAKAQLSTQNAARSQAPSDDTDTSDSSSDSSSEEDAPLSTFLNPSRPGSSMSQSTTTTSTARPGQRTKPLIDLKAECNPITGKPTMPAASHAEQRGRSSPSSHLSPTNINNRLSQLTANISTTSSSPSSITTSFSKSDLRGRGHTFERTDSSGSITTPDNRFKGTEPRNTPSPSRLTDKPLSASPTSATQSPLRELIHEARSSVASNPESATIVPVRERVGSHDRGFKVLSRPQRSQTALSLSSDSNGGSGSNVSNQPTRLDTQRRGPFAVTSRPTSGVLLNAEATKVQQMDRSSNVSTARTVLAAQPPPQRPFANVKRRDSPSSSTGGSSCGKAPLTPMDGSDLFIPEVAGGSEESPGNSTTGGITSAMKGARKHFKRASVTFQEPETSTRESEKVKSRSASHGTAPRPTVAADEEAKRRERRRSEAKAAIELGNVINGRGPNVDDDDGDADSDVAVGGGSRSRTSAINPLTRGMERISFSAPSNSWQGAAMPGMLNMGVNPSPYFVPASPMAPDPTFMMAHQQAMMVAKQAYQMAVAQQAMAAAGEEWERSSNVGGFSMGMGGMGGMSWMPSPMFPAGPQSMYAGSSIGGASNMGAGWGSASVYGETFGPPATITKRTPNVTSGGGDKRQSTNGARTFPRSESTGNLSGLQQQAQRASYAGSGAPRQRTRTAPSNSPLPTQHVRFGERQVPPSSWRSGY